MDTNAQSCSRDAGDDYDWPVREEEELRATMNGAPGDVFFFFLFILIKIQEETSMREKLTGRFPINHAHTPSNGVRIHLCL